MARRGLAGSDASQQPHPAVAECRPELPRTAVADEQRDRKPDEPAAIA